jgi:hypothetical protein
MPPSHNAEDDGHADVAPLHRGRATSTGLFRDTPIATAVFKELEDMLMLRRGPRRLVPTSRLLAQEEDSFLPGVFNLKNVSSSFSPFAISLPSVLE